MHRTVRRIITGDPADRKRIAELEGAIRLTIRDLDILDPSKSRQGFQAMKARLNHTLQSTEVRDGE